MRAGRLGPALLLSGAGLQAREARRQTIEGADSRVRPVPRTPGSLGIPPLRLLQPRFRTHNPSVMVNGVAPTTRRAGRSWSPVQTILAAARGANSRVLQRPMRLLRAQGASRPTHPRDSRLSLPRLRVPACGTRNRRLRPAGEVPACEWARRVGRRSGTQAWHWAEREHSGSAERPRTREPLMRLRCAGASGASRRETPPLGCSPDRPGEGARTSAPRRFARGVARRHR
jgi:hypothetical protein